MHIEQRFVDTLIEFQNSTPAAGDEIAILDKDQANQTLSLIDEFKTGSINEETFRTKLNDLYQQQNKTTMSATQTGNILNNLDTTP